MDVIMVHIRPREMTSIIAKELKFWPVVCLLGPRQCGKSTLLRELLQQAKKGTYKTLDGAADRLRAQNNPELYIEQVANWPLIIDEAHKAPPIFDEIKANVDREKRPGKFILSSSVRFSSKLGIRESLTGRASILRLDPLTISETESTTITLSEVQRYLTKGGMPGVCFLRDDDVILSYWDQWLETTCERDLQLLGNGRLSGALARLILEYTCTLDLPTSAAIAKLLRVDTRRVNSHLDALCELFLVREITPDLHGVGKSIYIPFDCGVAQHLKAPLRRLWQIWFVNERLNQQRFSGHAHPRPLSYYLTTRNSFVDFADTSGFHLYSDQPTVQRSELMTVKALRKKIGPDIPIFIHCATNSERYELEKNTAAVPWSALSSFDNMSASSVKRSKSTKN
jgi:predicted AAA+ superfamily ATPase